MSSDRGFTSLLLAGVALCAFLYLGSLTGVASAAVELDYDDGILTYQSGNGYYARYTGEYEGGTATSGQLGTSTADLGDLDGDGLPEVAIGEPHANWGDLAENGVVYVLYSRSGAQFGNFSLGDSSIFGQNMALEIGGATAGDLFGFSLASVGDLSGDGKRELLVGAPKFDDGAVDTGRSYLIYSQTLNNTTVKSQPIGDVAATTNWGYTIDGTNGGTAATIGRLGYAVSSTSDMTGDGLPETLVTDPEVGSAARAYVFYGQARGSQVDIDDASGPGYRITGTSGAAQSISGLKDVNNDGKGEVLVADEDAAFNGRPDAGAVYLLYGKSDVAPEGLDSLTPNQGYAIGAPGGINLTRSGSTPARRPGLLTSVPDMNDDGLEEIAIGASGYDLSADVLNSGVEYVVFPEPNRDTAKGNVDLAREPGGFGNDAWNGMKVTGASGGDNLGYPAKGADMNGDGIKDLFVGAPGTQRGGTSQQASGSLYVVFGRKTGGSISVADTPASSWGWAIDGGSGGSASSLGVSAVSIVDWNHDGLNDLSVTYPLTETRQYSTRAMIADAGTYYVVTARPVPEVESLNADEITSTTANVKAAINPRSFGSVEFYFELGETQTYGTNTAPGSIANGQGFIEAKSKFTGLKPCTKYQFRVVATNSDGFTSNGSDRQFTTSCEDATTTTTTTADTAVAESCSSKLFSIGRTASTSAAYRVGGVRTKLVGPTGSYVRGGTKTTFKLSTRKTADQSRFKRAVFYLDKTKLATITSPLFAIKLDTKKMTAEYGKGKKYSLSAKVTPKRGKTRKISLSFYVSKCRPATVTAALKRGSGRRADLSLTLKSGGPALTSASVALDKRVKLHPKAGAKIGTTKLTLNGKTSTLTLKVPKKASKRTTSMTVNKKGDRVVKLTRSAGRWRVALSGLSSGTDKVVVALKGRQSGQVTLAKPCVTKTFVAKFVGSGSGGSASTSDSASARCK